MRRAAAALGLLAALGAGCSLLPVGTNTEMQVADGAAFAGLHSYRIVAPEDELLPGSSAEVSARLRASIEQGLSSALSRKGYRRVSDATPADFRVQYRSAAVSRVDRDADPAPPVSRLTTVGGNDAATGYQPLAGTGVTSTIGRLVVYLNNEQTGAVIWQGTTEADTVGAGMAVSAAGAAAARLVRDVPGAAR